MFYSRKGCFKSGKWCPRTGNLVIFLWKFLIYFFPGWSGTEGFVPGLLLLPLSRDKGTPEQEFFFVPGQRDNGTSRPVETLVQDQTTLTIHAVKTHKTCVTQRRDMQFSLVDYWIRRVNLRSLKRPKWWQVLLFDSNSLFESPVKYLY